MRISALYWMKPVGMSSKKHMAVIQLARAIGSAPATRSELSGGPGIGKREERCSGIDAADHVAPRKGVSCMFNRMVDRWSGSQQAGGESIEPGFDRLGAARSFPRGTPRGDGAGPQESANIAILKQPAEKAPLNGRGCTPAVRIGRNSLSERNRRIFSPPAGSPCFGPTALSRKINGRVKAQNTKGNQEADRSGVFFCRLFSMPPCDQDDPGRILIISAANSRYHRFSSCSGSVSGNYPRFYNDRATPTQIRPRLFQPI